MGALRVRGIYFGIGEAGCCCYIMLRADEMRLFVGYEYKMR
jgi:hypothetical protein